MICLNCKMEKEQHYTWGVSDNKFQLIEDVVCKECDDMFKELEMIEENPEF